MLVNLKVAYGKVRLNLTYTNLKYESKNLPNDTLENFLVDEGLGYYQHYTRFGILKYRVPICQMKNMTSSYKDPLVIWYSIIQ